MSSCHRAKQARIDLTAALRWADRLGLSEGICNHFSLVVPGTTDRFLLNPQGIHWSELQASDLLIVDPDGHVVEGTGQVEPTARWQVEIETPKALVSRSRWRSSSGVSSLPWKRALAI